MKNIVPLLISGAAHIAAAHAQGSSPTSSYHGTSEWSSWAPVTVYATVTESTTIYKPVPTTIYVTISTTTTISTTVTATATTTITTTTPTTTTTTTEEEVTVTESFTATTPTTTTKPVTEFFTITTPTTTTKPVTEFFTATTPTTTTKLVTESFTATIPTTTTKPVTATEIIEEIVTSKTEALTITLCTARDTNPTYTAAILPLPSDYTWGCPPGYLCKPKQENCNFEVGLPAQSYYCAPDECIPVAAFPAQPQQWNANISGNASPANDPNLKWNVVDSYFEMNPRDFGLLYDIFVEDQVITYTYTTTIVEAPTPAVRVRQAETTVPPACYPWCNNGLLEAQAVGKTPALCTPGSAFEADLNDCQQCIAYHKSDSTTAGFVKIAPQFQQFINYCAQVSSSTVLNTATSTSTTTPVPVTKTSSSTSSTTAPTSTFSGSAVPMRRPDGIWTSTFSVLASTLALLFWI